MNREATGVESLLGMRLDEPSDVFNVGHSSVDVVVIDPPADEPTTGQHASTPTITRTVGAGLSDFTAGGSYSTPTIRQVINIVITASGTPDTMKYRVAYGPQDSQGNEHWGSFVTGVALTGSAQTITGGHGATVTAAATTGHTATNEFTIVYEAGALTGTFEYCETFENLDGFETSRSDISTPLTVTAKAIDVGTFTSIPATCDRANGYRRRNGGAWGLAYVRYDDEDRVDSVPESLIDYSKVPPAFNETGANGGYKFTNAISHTFEATRKYLDTKRLTGMAGAPAFLPGMVDYQQKLKDLLASGFIVGQMCTEFGRPLKYGEVAGAWVLDDGMTTFDGPSKKYVWTPQTMASWDAFSATFLAYRGGSLRPMLFPQHMISELDMTINGGAVVDADIVAIGIQHSRSGWALATSGGTPGQYANRAILYGDRLDDGKDTDDLNVKVTTAPSGGAFATQQDIGLGYGDTANYSYNTTSKRITRNPADPTDFVEIAANGTRLGGDDESHREPVTVGFPGDITTLEAAVVQTFKPEMEIPGLGSTPGTSDGKYSGFAPKKVLTPGFTAAHVTLYRGSVTADTYVEANTAKVKISQPKKVKAPLGNHAMKGINILLHQYAMAQIDMEQDLADRIFESKQTAYERIVAQLKVEGPRIRKTPGVFTAFRESFILDIPSVRIDKRTSPVAGPDVLKNSVSLVAEQLNDGTPLYTLSVITRENWNIPAAA